MRESENRLNDFIAEFDKNIKVAINGEAHYLAALGLSAYTEYVGGLFRKKFKEGNSEDNYNEGLKRMGKNYEELVNQFDRNDKGLPYKRIRCGLIHEFFIKKTSIIFLDKNCQAKCGLEIDTDDKIKFYLNTYYKDLKALLEKLMENCKKDSSMAKFIDETLPTIETSETTGVLDFGIKYPNNP